MSFLVVRNPKPLFVSSLPSSAADGQEIYYQSTTAGTGGGSTDTMATDGAVWHLRYNANSSSSYKWEFLGGSTLNDITAAEETRSVGTGYGTLTTGGPSITLPLAGDYIVSLSAYFRSGASNGVAWFSYQIGATAAQDGDALWGEAAGDANSPSLTSTFTRLKTGLTAVTLSARYKATGSSSSASFSARSMFVTPVRVG